MFTTYIIQLLLFSTVCSCFTKVICGPLNNELLQGIISKSRSAEIESVSEKIEEVGQDPNRREDDKTWMNVAEEGVLRLLQVNPSVLDDSRHESATPASYLQQLYTKLSDTGTDRRLVSIGSGERASGQTPTIRGYRILPDEQYVSLMGEFHFYLDESATISLDLVEVALRRRPLPKVLFKDSLLVDVFPLYSEDEQDPRKALPITSRILKPPIGPNHPTPDYEVFDVTTAVKDAIKKSQGLGTKIVLKMVMSIVGHFDEDKIRGLKNDFRNTSDDHMDQSNRESWYGNSKDQSSSYMTDGDDKQSVANVDIMEAPFIQEGDIGHADTDDSRIVDSSSSNKNKEKLLKKVFVLHPHLGNAQGEEPTLLLYSHFTRDGIKMVDEARSQGHRHVGRSLRRHPHGNRLDKENMLSDGASISSLVYPYLTNHDGFQMPPNTNSMCTLHSWYVNFRELNWEHWLIQPPGYYANYCAGLCPDNVVLPERLNATNHAHVKNMYLALRGGTRSGMRYVPTASCVPTSLDPISILHLDDNGTTVYKVMSDMQATSCGCH